MNYADGDMIEGIYEITKWLKTEAENILALLDNNQLDDANQIIKAARLSVQQTRRSFVEALAALKLLQASFIASAEIV